MTIRQRWFRCRRKRLNRSVRLEKWPFEAITYNNLVNDTMPELNVKQHCYDYRDTFAAKYDS